MRLSASDSEDGGESSVAPLVGESHLAFRGKSSNRDGTYPQSFVQRSRMVSQLDRIQFTSNAPTGSSVRDFVQFNHKRFLSS